MIGFLEARVSGSKEFDVATLWVSESVLHRHLEATLAFSGSYVHSSLQCLLKI